MFFTPSESQHYSLAVRFLITRTEEIEVQTMLSKFRNSFFLLNLIACYRILQRKRRQSHPKRAEAACIAGASK
jgi:hypothetical protein